jgi:hypothetical protein
MMSESAVTIDLKVIGSLCFALAGFDDVAGAREISAFRRSIVQGL